MEHMYKSGWRHRCSVYIEFLVYPQPCSMSVWETVSGSTPLLLVTSVLSIWSLCWIIAYVTCGVCKSRARLDGKTIIITGCTAGIGKATAFDLARRGGRIIMACRNVEKANAVRDEIVAVTGNSSVVVRQLDVAVLGSVRQFAEDTLRSEDRLDVLIHNAGIYVSNKATEDGINEVWATNYFGPFLLTNLLIDLLKATGKSRIVFVASAFHYFGGVSLKHPNPQTSKIDMQFYSNSKFAVILIAKELARRLRSGVTSNSVHPGAIYTAMYNDAPLQWRFLANISKPLLKTVEQGAQTTIHAAVSKELEVVSGQYFTDCKKFPPAWGTRDVELAKRFWELSEEIVHLRPTDPRI